MPGSKITENPDLAIVARAIGDSADMLETLVRDLAIYADARIAAHVAGKYMQKASLDAASDPPNAPPGPLKIRKTRLLRAATSKPYGGQPEFEIEFSFSKALMKWIKTITVPYAAIHEHGGSFNLTITAQMRRFFWARYMATKDNKWRAMALTPKTSFNIVIEARPYIGPSVSHAEPEVVKKAISLLKTMISLKLKAL